MNLLEVVTPLSIYHGLYTRKTFWKENFTQVNMKNCGHLNVRKHRGVKNGENYISLVVSLNFGGLKKMKITSSEPKDYLGRLGKGLITSLVIKTIRKSNKIKKARFAIDNVILKDLYNITKEFEYLSYEGYVRKRSKRMPTDSYFFIER